MRIKVNKKKYDSETTTGHGCNINDKRCIIESIFTKIPEDDLLDFFKVLITDEVKEVLEDPDLSKCSKSFFESNLNASISAKTSFVHRNTILYRLKKIRSVSGYDIRKFEDAVNFKIITMLYKLFK